MHKKMAPGMNRFQKAAHRPGEKRVSREDIAVLLELSCSEEAEERTVAATYLCPCHVRHRNEEVWAALYRMMEDPDVGVRRRAWHTLEDGGRPNDPAFEPILKRTLEHETDRTVLGFARMFSKPLEEKERLRIDLAGRPEKKTRGRCDFCGEPDVFVRRDLETTIPDGAMSRAAWMCEACAKVSSAEHLL